jgi:hypothetical protein
LHFNGKFCFNWRPFGIFYINFGIFNGALVYFLVIWHVFSRFGVLCQEKSYNQQFGMYKICKYPVGLLKSSDFKQFL